MKEIKEKLLISVSGGETSLRMAKWIWDNWRDRYDIVCVFANTGEENFQTLLFLHWFEKYFEIPVYWIEAKVFQGERKSSGYEIVDFYNCSRQGEPFFEITKKYGLPNMNSPHCTRELKERPIRSFAKFFLGWNDYFMAIGIRADEADRVSTKRIEKRLLYPLISNIPHTKQMVNAWWSAQPFRLFLKGYQDPARQEPARKPYHHLRECREGQ